MDSTACFKADRRADGGYPPGHHVDNGSYKKDYPMICVFKKCGCNDMPFWKWSSCVYDAKLHMSNTGDELGRGQGPPSQSTANGSAFIVNRERLIVPGSGTASCGGLRLCSEKFPLLVIVLCLNAPF